MPASGGTKSTHIPSSCTETHDPHRTSVQGEVENVVVPCNKIDQGIFHSSFRREDTGIRYSRYSIRNALNDSRLSKIEVPAK